MERADDDDAARAWVLEERTYPEDEPRRADVFAVEEAVRLR